MPLILLPLLLITLCLFAGNRFTEAAVKGGPSWGYGEGDGPKMWAKNYPMCGSGKRQSPIDIQSEGARHKYSLSELRLKHYEDDITDAIVHNYGTTLKMFANGSKAEISGGCMRERVYRFLEAHFHWGKKNSVGSEHQIDGKSFPLEMHLVHYNAAYKKEEALNKSDGFAVLGVFFQVVKKENKKLAPLFDAIEHLADYGEEERLDDKIRLADFLPKDLTFYYCYEGSLTTPSCDEVVTWTVLGQHNEISEKQLEELRGVRNNAGEKIADNGNFRPVQKLLNRQVYVKGQASLTTATSTVVLLTTALSFSLWR